MKNLITFPIILLISLLFSSSLVAHEINGPGEQPEHQHVYKNNAYGTASTVGHYAQPAGSRGILIWQASPNRNYGKSQSGFKIPKHHSRPPSQKQLYQQKPAFNKNSARAPDLDRK